MWVIYTIKYKMIIHIVLFYYCCCILLNITTLWFIHPQSHLISWPPEWPAHHNRASTPNCWTRIYRWPFAYLWCRSVLCYVHILWQNGRKQLTSTHGLCLDSNKTYVMMIILYIYIYLVLWCFSTDKMTHSLNVYVCDRLFHSTFDTLLRSLANFPTHRAVSCEHGPRVLCTNLVNLLLYIYFWANTHTPKRNRVARKWKICRNILLDVYIPLYIQFVRLESCAVNALWSRYDIAYSKMCQHL